MKNLLMLPALIALASCAPTATVEKPTTDMRSYAATCTAALAAVAEIAPQIRPAALQSGVWNPFKVTDRTADTLTTTATSIRIGTFSYGFSTSNESTTSILWKCTEAGGRATLFASSTGQQARYAQAGLDAFWQTLTLPK